MQYAVCGYTALGDTQSMVSVEVTRYGVFRLQLAFHVNARLNAVGDAPKHTTTPHTTTINCRVALMARLSTPATKSKTPKPPASNNGQHAPSPAHEAALRTLPRQELHRPTKQVSYELANHAKAYLEGGQCI